MPQAVAKLSNVTASAPTSSPSQASQRTHSAGDAPSFQDTLNQVKEKAKPSTAKPASQQPRASATEREAAKAKTTNKADASPASPSQPKKADKAPAGKPDETATSRQRGNTKGDS